MTADPLSAQEAFALGLVNKVVPQERLMDETLRVARKISRVSPLSVRAIKEKIYAGSYEAHSRLGKTIIWEE